LGRERSGKEPSLLLAMEEVLDATVPEEWVR
jgi:hypothetical protein